MFEPGAECPECTAKLTMEGCKECGWTPRKAATVASGSPLVPSPYREVQPRERPTSSPDDKCPEPDCTKTVREHIAEAKHIGQSDAWALRFGSQR